MKNHEITITLNEAEATILRKALLQFSTSTTSPVEEEVADTIYIKSKAEA